MIQKPSILIKTRFSKAILNKPLGLSFYVLAKLSLRQNWKIVPLFKSVCLGGAPCLHPQRPVGKRVVSESQAMVFYHVHYFKLLYYASKHTTVECGLQIKIKVKNKSNNTKFSLVLKQFLNGQRFPAGFLQLQLTVCIEHIYCLDQLSLLPSVTVSRASSICKTYICWW